ncbi:15605_t:CDS:2 [Cetraspora pellucida]|uniref:15605_t:CDS:1 n=1 Tax=Cetraspora pellucida TaxID=1433469 RepID=A0A9N9CNA5_9GLOM|nr:15605_t:CDS:2 [Cetraspora pellucida]
MSPTKRASSKYSDWFEKALRDGIITLYKYSLYSNVKEVGKGGFGIVYSADYEGRKVALKSVNTNEVTKEFVIELKRLSSIKSHPNLNQFHGVTIDTKTGNLMLVLQFANRGNLRQYSKDQ